MKCTTMLKKILYPLIWIKSLKGTIIQYLTKKIIQKTGTSKPNRFKTWKLKQPFLTQLLIELPVYILILWILNIIFNSFGYEITPW